MPNPNVLIELGYAIKAMGHERIILVFNKSFGKVEELPFDLRTRRVLVYEMPEDNVDRASERKKLSGQFESTLRGALGALPAASTTPPIAAVSAIENVVPNRKIILRRTLEEIMTKLGNLEPKLPRDGGTVKDLISGIESTQEVVAEFSKVAEAAAIMDDSDLAIDIHRWFGKIFDRYSLPDGFSGPCSTADHDFFKFIGHEMFVSHIALHMREGRWGVLNQLLHEPISTRSLNHGPIAVDWSYASEHLMLLIDEARQRQRISLHGDLLVERHANGGGLATVVPLEDLMNADFFLFLLSRVQEAKSAFDNRYWRAWSCLGLHHPPIFIQKSVQKRFAEEIAKLLGLQNIEDYKELVLKRAPEIERLFSGGFWRYPIADEDVNKIGSR